MATNSARGQATRQIQPDVAAPAHTQEAARPNDWLRDPQTPPSGRRAPSLDEAPAAASSTPVLNRLTAQFDRLRSQDAIDAPSLAEMLERRRAVRRAREAEMNPAPGAAQVDAEPQDTDAISATLHEAIADIITRQRTLDVGGAAAAVVEDSGPARKDDVVRAADVFFDGDEAQKAEPEANAAVDEAARATSAKLRNFFSRVDERARSVQSLAAQPHRNAPDDLKSSIDQLIAQFDETAHRGFDRIENCHAEIMRAIRESREAGTEAAEAAAARGIETGFERLGGTLSERIEEIARGIADLRADSSAGERRTCEMLDAVRETLEIVAARLPQKTGATEPSFSAERHPEVKPEHSRFIAAARRSAGTERIADVPANFVGPQIPTYAEPAADPEPEDRAPKIELAEKPKVKPATISKTAPKSGWTLSRLHKRLMIGGGAGLLLVASYGGAMMLLERSLSTPSLELPPMLEEPIATVAPEAGAEDGSFSTIEAGAPPTYRPAEPAQIDQPLPEPELPAATPELPVLPEAAFSEPTMTGSIPRSAEPAQPVVTESPLQRRLAAGEPAALYEAGLRMAEGQGMERDPAQAAELLRRAADAGLVPAQYLLGNLKEKGLAGPKDIAAARKLYEQAAASGNVQSMHNLGVLHAEGGLGRSDMTAAADWFSRAAEFGLKDSQYNLGVIKARGLAGKPDLASAYQWFALAGRQGDTDAAAKRDQIAAKLSSEQLATAKSRVTQWKASPVVAKANVVAPPPEGWDVPETARAATASPVPVIR
jgi:TPR repeat protein